MNFLPAQLDGGRLRLPFGEVPFPAELRRRLESGGGGSGQVIAGIRPEDFEDAEIVGADKAAHGHTFETTVSLTESMGSEIYAYFEFEGEAATSEELQDLAADAGTMDVPGAGDARVVARLDPASRAAAGQTARIWMDTSKLHLFDARDGRNLTRAEQAASGGAVAAR